MRVFVLTAFSVVLCFVCASAFAADANRLSYLSELCNPYYVGRDFPKLITPQWVGEEGVEAVVVLAIDDMRDTAKYEAYLRPILSRLQQIDGRAAVSIMTCRIDPRDPQLKSWVDEGLSMEVHTVDHPCPLLQGGDFAKAKSTYDRCVDLMNQIPGNTPVAFRMPCCDSLNTPSPRFWVEIFNRTTERGHFLQIDSSVFNITTSADADLPRSLTLDADGSPRFRKYLPFPSFVNTIEDYPYPYVVGNLCWEFPCAVPSDWEAQNLQQPNNPRTVEDLKAVLDVTVIKQGVFNLVFHPHGWIRNDQIIELIDHAVTTYGERVKFLTFREAAERINKHLLVGEPLRDAQGRDNGVRLLDLNNDGLMDVHIGNKRRSLSRVWTPQGWRDVPHHVRLVGQVARQDSQRGVQWDTTNTHNFALGVLRPHGFAVHFERQLSIFTLGDWRHFAEFSDGSQQIAAAAQRDSRVRATGDWGLRMRDLDHDGVCEILISNAEVNKLFRWDAQRKRWQPLPFGLPANTQIVDRRGRDAGLRFVDVNQDQRDDVIFSDGRRYSLHVFDSIERGWKTLVDRRRGTGRGEQPAIPMIVRPDGTNNGAWFHSGTMWVQNEDTNRLPDLVDRLSFSEMLSQQ